MPLLRTPFLVVLVLATATASALACTCIEPPPPEEAFERADAVFQARVDFQREIDFDLEVQLIVQRSWKGVTTARVTLRTFATGAACGYPFVTGETYVVYADDLADEGLPSSWRTSLCSRTTPLATATEDLDFLTTGRTIVDADATSWTTTKALFHR